VALFSSLLKSVSELSTNDNGGIAQYVNGVTSGLAYTSGSQVVLAVDSTPNASPRKAVRMHSKTRFNAQDNNLFIFDVAHIPAVCGTWPAIWVRAFRKFIAHLFMYH
jgi:hypothetical protein